MNRGGLYWIRAPDLPPFDLGGRSEGLMLVVLWPYGGFGIFGWI